MTTLNQRIPLDLLLLRLSVFLVMLMWTLDKFFNPDHAAAIYQNFYFISGLGNVIFYIIGAIQLLIILAFVTGIKKTVELWCCLIFSCRFHSVFFQAIFKSVSRWKPIIFCGLADVGSLLYPLLFKRLGYAMELD